MKNQENRLDRIRKVHFQLFKFMMERHHRVQWFWILADSIHCSRISSQIEQVAQKCLFLDPNQKIKKVQAQVEIRWLGPE